MVTDIWSVITETFSNIFGTDKSLGDVIADILWRGFNFSIGGVIANMMSKVAFGVDVRGAWDGFLEWLKTMFLGLWNDILVGLGVKQKTVTAGPGFMAKNFTGAQSMQHVERLANRRREDMASAAISAFSDLNLRSEVGMGVLGTVNKRYGWDKEEGWQKLSDDIISMIQNAKIKQSTTGSFAFDVVVGGGRVLTSELKQAIIDVMIAMGLAQTKADVNVIQ
jgi:hypothetical protein